MSNSFKRNKEDFICEHCGAEVKGNGYTNHCPVCLWSKHVDINPGDRANACQGLMPPIRVEMEGQDKIIVTKCQKCGIEKRNKAAEGDSFDALLAISRDSIYN